MAGTASSGRRKKSAQAHVLSGTFRDDRHAGSEAPPAPAGVPEMPMPLEGDALGEWHRMIRRLSQLGTLSLVDDACLYQHCLLFAETEQLRSDQETARGSARILEENIRDVEGPELVELFRQIAQLRKDIKGYSSSLRSNHMAARQYLVEFGLTPSARTRVKLPPQKPQADPAKAKYGSLAG